VFGFFRTFLALMVVAQHLLGVPNVGGYAVIGFFILSGYLMTMITCERYGFTSFGIALYFTNRALRLYPTNILVIGLTVILIMLLGETYTTSFSADMAIPKTLGDWLSNISMIYPNFRPVEVVPRLSPPTWALTIELFFYALIGFGIARYRIGALIWFVASLIITGVLIVASGAHREMTSDLIYFSIASGSLPFSMGALLYHYRNKLPILMCGAKVGVVAAAYGIVFLLIAVAMPVAAKWFGIPSFGLFRFYTNVILQFAFIAFLAGVRLDGNLRTLDTTVGSYSYPIYLLHFACGALVSYVLFGATVSLRSLDALVVFSASLPLLFILAHLIVAYVDRPVETVRKRIKSKD
jgi:peptidoglycan/LPS O-acetylase OafA/YrhL